MTYRERIISLCIGIATLTAAQQYTREQLYRSRDHINRQIALVTQNEIIHEEPVILLNDSDVPIDIIDTQQIMSDSRRAFVTRWNTGVRKAHSFVVQRLFNDNQQ